MLFNRKIYPQSEAKSYVSFLKRCQIVGIGAGLDKEWEEGRYEGRRGRMRRRGRVENAGVA